MHHVREQSAKAKQLSGESPESSDSTLLDGELISTRPQGRCAAHPIRVNSRSSVVRPPKSTNSARDTSPPPKSKHKRRRERRELYYRMIDGELPQERSFSGRIIDTVNHDGMDIAHDGRPIKSFWRHYLKTRDFGRNANAKACLYLLERTYRSVRPKVYL